MNDDVCVAMEMGCAALEETVNPLNETVELERLAKDAQLYATACTPVAPINVAVEDESPAPPRSPALMLDRLAHVMVIVLDVITPTE
jgi:hypothetical protein